MGVIKRIVDKQPLSIKKIYYNIVPFKYRYGQDFSTKLSFLNEVAKWSYDQTKDYQLTKLKNILDHSYKNVPYYSKLFKKCDFNPDIKFFDEIKKIPILTKEIIRNNFSDLIATNFSGRKILFKTSGSTGKRLEFFGEDKMYKQEAAYILNSFQSHGANLYDEWSIWIRRHSPKNENDLIVKDFELKRVYMSPFHLNDENICKYVEIINKTKSKTIVTYPSTAYWLSCLMEKHNLKLPYVKSLHGASEQCLDLWSEKIENVFGFKFKMHYGLVEKTTFMYQSSQSDFYHEDLTYSYNEFDEFNTIIGTSFQNYVMPFIRYKTTDIVTLNSDVEFNTSRPLVVSKIDGRVDDMVVSENNSKIPSVNFYTVMSKIEGISMFQILQNKDKSITFKFVTNDKFRETDLNFIETEIQKRIGMLPIQFEKVSEIERDFITGKIRCVKTNVV